jgi:hypothetical protein
MQYWEIKDSGNGKQINVFDERYYQFETSEGLILKPSVTFIQNSDVGIGLMNFYKEHGIYSNDIVEFAKNVGSEFHRIVEILLKQGSVDFSYIDDRYKLEVWYRVIRFYEFFNKHLIGHDILGIEIICEGADYAGTVDLLTHKDGLRYIWDWKTSKQVYDHHKSQVSAYAKALNADVANVVCFPEKPLTKQGYSITTLNSEQIEEHFEEFLFIKQKFDKTHKEPLFKTLPIKLTLETI